MYKTLITGFPRIGIRRELKKALESYWSHTISAEELLQTAKELRKKHWLLQKKHEIDLISCNDFSLYDGMLDTIVMLGAVPKRFILIDNKLDQYFAMARGTQNAPAMEMTKWFNTNYHYIVPELGRETTFNLNISKLSDEFNEARELGIYPKINLIGPLTFLGLSKSTDGSDPMIHADIVTALYASALQQISLLGENIVVQIEEPIFAKDVAPHLLELLERTYQHLAAVSPKIKIIVSTYFAHSCEATETLCRTGIWGIGLDFVHGKKNMKSIPRFNGKKLIAGVVDGQNVWVNNLSETVSVLENFTGHVERSSIIISSSCSLLHSPFCTSEERESPINDWLSFACEKVEEISLIGKLFHHAPLSASDLARIEKNAEAIRQRNTFSEDERNTDLNKQKTSQKKTRQHNYAERRTAQKELFKLPKLPTTTIGSFPQTPELRKLRSDFKNRVISEDYYKEKIKHSILNCIRFQEETGLDVLVHGEPERNDMVEYFGELLEGFHFTANGWVQSYGSRCVKPPIIYSTIKRLRPMTVMWIEHAQSLTDKIVKGMLTGPVTLLNWSFVRDDLPYSEVAYQLAEAIAGEITDLQNAGIRIIQVDEAAFKEGYPLRNEDIPEYENWAVDSFRSAVSTANKETQIHTHMCYSDFSNIMPVIERMDADVITIETARSGSSMLEVFREAGYSKDIGPGVFDIHSPRIPETEELKKKIKELIKIFPKDRLWINPDCGLKTRLWSEVQPALKNMIQAVREIRTE